MDIPNKKLSIQKKIIYIIIFCSLFFIIIFYIFSSTFLMKSFMKLEDDQVIRNLDRVEFSIKNIIENQSTKIKDWAYWDDTYNFIEDKNKEYIDSNLTNESLSSLNINTMIFINSKDEIVYSKFINAETGLDLPKEAMLSYIKSNLDSIKNLNGISKINNIIKIPEGEMLISIDKILESDGKGESKGYLIFGSFINKSTLNTINGIVGFKVELFPYNDFSTVSDIAIAKTNLQTENQHYIYVAKNGFIDGATLINDIYDKPIYVVRVEIPRDIYNQGKYNFNIFFIISVLSIIFLDLLIYQLIRKFIIIRLSKLVEKVDIISTSGYFSENLDEDINDEVGNLSISINKMLSKIRESQKIEKKLDEEQKIMNEKIKIHANEVEKINKLMIGRELKMIELKKENLKLKGEENN